MLHLGLERAAELFWEVELDHVEFDYLVVFQLLEAEDQLGVLGTAPFVVDERVQGVRIAGVVHQLEVSQIPSVVVMVLMHRKVEMHAAGFRREHRVGAILRMDGDNLNLLDSHPDLNYDCGIILTRVTLLNFVHLHQLVLVVGFPDPHRIGPLHLLWGLVRPQLDLPAVLVDDALQLLHLLEGSLPFLGPLRINAVLIRLISLLLLPGFIH